MSVRRPQLLLFDPNLKSAQGHNLDYANRLLRCATEAGLDSVIVASSKFEGMEGPFKTLALLEQDYWHELAPGPGEDPFDHLAKVANAFMGSLLHVVRERCIDNRDVLFFPCANLAETMGLVRLGLRIGKPMPRTVLLFRRDLEEQGALAGVGPRTGVALLRQALADLESTAGSGRVRLFTDSDNLTEEYGEAAHRRFQTAPIPVDFAFAPLPCESQENGRAFNILYIGDARREKGYHRLPGVADRLLAQLAAGRVRMVLQSNFNLPGGEPGIGPAREALSKAPGVVLLERALTPREYIDRVHEADLMVLPYERACYAARTSGILAEAIVAGVPVVVPAGTWLSDQLRRHGAGVAYPGESSQSFADAVLSALDQLPPLKQKALERRSSFADFHNPGRLLRFVCGNETLARAEEIEAAGLCSDCRDLTQRADIRRETDSLTS